jgi:hypothetical protein
MASERKSILLRIPPEVWEAISRSAQRDLRSVNAQIEVMIREGLASRGMRPVEPGASREEAGPSPRPEYDAPTDAA